jgi:hypothetical protein
MNCPVYQAGQSAMLPAQFRGSSSAPSRRRKSKASKARRMTWSAVAFLLLILAIITARELLLGYSPGWHIPGLASVPSMIPSIGIVETRDLTPKFVSPSQALPLVVGDTPKIPSATQGKPIPSRTSIPKRCGYTLDTTFGTDVKFTIHQIASGENLDKLAELHQTTVDAIRAVNFSMPLPIWENWIVVIPVGIEYMQGLPAFEPYQADGTIFLLSDLAIQLDADIQALANYNAFTDACTVFRGWLIVPRPSQSTSN